jgi:hypothetical protein
MRHDYLDASCAVHYSVLIYMIVHFNIYVLSFYVPHLPARTLRKMRIICIVILIE